MTLFSGRRWIPVALAAVVLASACTFGRMVRHGFSGVDDYQIFPNRVMTRADAPFVAPTAPDAATRYIPWEGQGDLDAFMAANDTLALIVQRGGTIVHERYYNGHSREAMSMSFSMAKSITSMLVGCAIADGKIASADQPVTDFVPELADRGFANVRLRHLLQMTAGTNYVDSDWPWRRHPALYYTEHMEPSLLRIRVVDEPGSVDLKWRYKSGETLLLGLALSRALAPETISAYMQRRVWHPVGAEGPGLWAVDNENGLEKVYCCMTARARDFLKIGVLYRDRGRWGDAPIVPAEWVSESTRVDESEGSPWNYQYQWWLPDREGNFMAIGHLGQYIYVDRARDAVLLRLGTSRGHLNPREWRELLPRLLDAVLARSADDEPPLN